LRRSCPRISYLTLMNGFLNMSFFVVCATVVVNLWVGSLDLSIHQLSPLPFQLREDARHRFKGPGRLTVPTSSEGSSILPSPPFLSKDIDRTY